MKIKMPSDPWFFEKLDGSNYYGTSDRLTYFRCPQCKEIRSKNLLHIQEGPPSALFGYECECGHVLTVDDIWDWKEVEYDPDFIREYRRKNP